MSPQGSFILSSPIAIKTSVPCSPRWWRLCRMIISQGHQINSWLETRLKWPRYWIKYSFFPFLEPLYTWSGDFIPQPPLFLWAHDDQLQGLVVYHSLGMGHSVNHWSLNEQVKEEHQKRWFSAVTIRTKGSRKEQSRDPRPLSSEELRNDRAATKLKDLSSVSGWH